MTRALLFFGMLIVEAVFSGIILTVSVSADACTDPNYPTCAEDNTISLALYHCKSRVSDGVDYYCPGVDPPTSSLSTVKCDSNCTFSGVCASTSEDTVDCILVGTRCILSGCTSSGVCCVKAYCGDSVCSEGENCEADCCTSTAPDAPVLVSPLQTSPYVQVRVGEVTVLDWSPVSNWGTGCPSNTNTYQVCVSGTTSCDVVNKTGISSATTSYNWTPGTADSSVSWLVRASNGSEVKASSTRNVCVEGGVSYGSWSACDANHKRTRTCTETCGTDDCAAAGAIGGVVTDDCLATINGTLFDASDLASCPGDIGTNPAYASVRYGSQPFGINGVWGVVSAPVVTDSNGNYSELVYASNPAASYTFDFSEMINSGMVSGLKLSCQGQTADLTVQDQIVTRDFGFWRVYGGWWQVVGGSVYGKNGVQSDVPASLSPVGDQKLILPSTDGRSGFLSYGTVWQGNELGTNPNAVPGVPYIESIYKSLRYDYNFYKTRTDVFASTAWDGGDFTYDDGGKGYQILKHTGDVTLPAKTLTTEKMIMLVDGSVSVTGNLVVPEGAFLAVIARGSLTFDPGVSQAQGWFVAENINVPCKDTTPSDGTCDKDGELQFLGEGSFVGWSNINLSRDRGLTNNQAPSEKFTYRPDFLLNAPAPMKIYTRKYTPFVP